MHYNSFLVTSQKHNSNLRFKNVQGQAGSATRPTSVLLGNMVVEPLCPRDLVNIKIRRHAETKSNANVRTSHFIAVYRRRQFFRRMGVQSCLAPSLQFVIPELELLWRRILYGDRLMDRFRNGCVSERRPYPLFPALKTLSVRFAETVTNTKSIASWNVYGNKSVLPLCRLVCNIFFFLPSMVTKCQLNAME